MVRLGLRESWGLLPGHFHRQLMPADRDPEFSVRMDVAALVWTCRIGGGKRGVGNHELDVISAFGGAVPASSRQTRE